MWIIRIIFLTKRAVLHVFKTNVEMHRQGNFQATHFFSRHSLGQGQMSRRLEPRNPIQNKWEAGRERGTGRSGQLAGSGNETDSHQYLKFFRRSKSFTAQVIK